MARDVHTLAELHAYGGARNVLLMFAPADFAGPATTQEELLGMDLNAVAELDLVLLHVAEADGADELRSEFDVAKGSFAVVLLDKDGETRARSHEPMKVDYLRRALEGARLGENTAGSR